MLAWPRRSHPAHVCAVDTLQAMPRPSYARPLFTSPTLLSVFPSLPALDPRPCGPHIHPPPCTKSAPHQHGQCHGHVILSPVPQHRISGCGAAGEQSSSHGQPPSSRVPWPRSSCSWMETGPSVAPTGDSPAFWGLGTEVAPVPIWFLPLILPYDTLVIPVHGSPNC